MQKEAAKSVVGQYSICQLIDGFVPMDGTIFPDSLSEEGKRIRRSNGYDEDGVIPSPASAFLLRHKDGKHLLVDSGCGSQFGASFGKAPRLLTEMGVDHDKINGVMFTHLHPDHLGGVVDDEGNARYKNATLYVSEKELSFWQDPKSRKEFPKLDEEGSFDQVLKLLAPYLKNDRVKGVKPGQEMFPGITFKSLPGHTPGHCGVSISDQGDKALVWGDTVHSQAYQFVHPNWSAAFDMNGPQALQTRLDMFKELEASDVEAFGPHVYGCGLLRKNTDGEYHFVSREKASKS